MRAIWLIACLAAVGARSPGAANSETNAVPARDTTVRLSEAERKWLDTHAEVRWGFDPDWPPFSSFDRNQQLSGIDADITRLVAERVGLRVTIVRAASWAEVLAKAKAGEVDFLSATARTPERLEAFDFSNDYGGFPVVIIMRNDAPFLTPTPQLGSMTISAARDHVTTRQVQRDFPTAHFVLTDSAEEAVKLVAHGKTDATVANLAVVTRVIRTHGLTNLKICGITRYEFPLHFAVRKDAHELTAILNKGLGTITSDELERIYAAHLTPDIAEARDWGVWRRRAIYATLTGGTLVGLVVLWNRFLSREIRRRKVAETALSEALVKLQRRTVELDKRVVEVEQLNGDLRAANLDLESFSSSVSHDLRAPLRRISSFAQMAQSEAHGGLARKASQWVSIIIDEAKRMDLLICDLLEFARLGRTELHKRPVNMQQLVRNVIDDAEPQWRDRDVAWKIGDLCEVDGDPALLRSALANLIDNALKYTRGRPRAEIAIDLVPESSHQGEATFYVRDNGCGFDMRQAGKLFAPFQRLHSACEYEGTGIGLANVQRIIQKHGGRVWFQSEPNKGATFYFTLPRNGKPAR